jgi:hypothetical protein
MVDFSITASQVLPGSEAAGATFENGIAGVAVTAGQAVYLEDATKTFKLADNNDTSAALSVVRGVTLHAASAGQPLRVQTGGPLTIGAGAAIPVGRVVVLSATAGGLAPVSDLTTGNRTTIIGIGGASSSLILRPWASLQVAP